MQDDFNTLIVFPTSRAIRQYVDDRKSTNSFLIKAISIGDFFSKVVLSKDKVLISSDLRILYLKEAISKIDIDKLGLSSNFSKFYTQSEYIFKFFNELNSEFKNIDDLNDADTYAFYLEHLSILKQIYKKYSEILEKNNCVDSSLLPTNYEINHDYINTYKYIQINYEGYFSSYEFEIIKKISKFVNVKIDVLINEFNTKNIELFDNINVDVKVNTAYTIDISNEIIINEKPYNNKLKNHVIYPIKQRITQVAFIKYSIANMIKSGLQAQNIAVILPDEKFVMYLKLFDNEKNFNFAMGNDIKNSHTLKTANAIYVFLNKNEPKDAKRIQYFDIPLEYIQNDIEAFWNKNVKKDNLFDIIDYINSNEKDTQIQEKIFEIKLSLENLLFNDTFVFEEQIKLKDAYKIYLSKLNKITIDDTRSGKITVIGILESRSVSYDGVIVIDFNDDKVPKRSIKDKFISTKVKKQASLPTLKHREDLQKYYYKRLFDKAKQISISYVNDDANTISRFSTQIFDKSNIIKADFSNILQKYKEINIFDDDIVHDIDLSLQEWSATSLKTYLQCKRKYYFSYILKIKDHSISLKPQAYELGKIVHDVLEKIYKHKNVSYENLCKHIDIYQNKNPYLSLELEIWKKKLQKFINKEQIRFKQGINVYSLEKKFYIIYKGIKIKGAIDRIDKLKDNSYAILDYKTSSSLKIDSAKTLEHANDFQLEFYYLALRDLNVSQVSYYDLNDASIKDEILLNEKIALLDNIFISLKTKNVNFTKCKDTKVCTFCIYKTICNR